MDISVIDATKVNTETGLHIGESNAPVKMIEFINVRCPIAENGLKSLRNC